MPSSDWLPIEKPPVELVQRLAPIPGAKFDIAQGRVTAVRLHRSILPLVGLGNRFFNGPIRDNVELFPFLRSYQVTDLPYLLNRRSSILGYEMRLGKTATAVCAWTPSQGPLLITGPLIARDVWRYWVEKVHGVSLVCLESKTDIALPGFPAYFVHFDILDAHSGFLQTLKPSLLVIDEIHMLQARKSLRMSAMSLIAPNASRIIGLSGTPMWSDPRSMWPILNLLAPGAWGSEFEFCQRYMNAENGAYGWKYNGTANVAEFQSRLSEVIIRRTWKDVAPELPPTVNVVEIVTVNEKEAKSLTLQAERARLSTGKPNSWTSQVAHLATLRKRYGMLKVKRAVELAVQALADGHKVLLWTWHVEVASAVYDALAVVCEDYSLATIRAEDSQDTRAAWIQAFQDNPRPMPMVIPLAVGGVAIDLSSADVNIFVEQDWIPATNYQASMRVFKPGRSHANVWMFCDADVERNLMSVLEVNEACQTATGLGYEEIASRVLDSTKI